MNRFFGKQGQLVGVCVAVSCRWCTQWNKKTVLNIGSRLIEWPIWKARNEWFALTVKVFNDLLPLDRRRWLAANVVTNAVDASDFVDDAGADPGQ